jgi:[glutamine synthetase] adenylyltransferase / [glutamine synthetase]-adenylyl-L-tyrosine phosphorylase
MTSGLYFSDSSLASALALRLGEGMAALPRGAMSRAALQERNAWLESLGQGDDYFSTLAPDVQEFLSVVAQNAPFLRKLMMRETINLKHLLTQPMALVYDRIIAKADDSAACGDLAKSQRELRHAKQSMALFLALADLGCVSTTPEIMQALSHFADRCINAAFLAALGDVTGQTPDLFDQDLIHAEIFGICVIAMGKLGAEELNYSSDVDIIVLFDPDGLPFKANEKGLRAPPPGFDIARFMKRITHKGVALLNDQTEDGYVFRTDLRLRPNPGSTPAAVSIHFAERYYEMSGQNWERAAFIKARAVAGDRVLGRQFLERLRPFVWRKYLDYAAIEDIHSIKRQIHAVKGGGEIEFIGHDLKLGRGGIREIEFFVQTQQLILGGKNPALRARETLQSLIDLQAAGQISQKAREELSEAYLFLRHVEHRLQMLEDAQTHNIPKNIIRRTHLAHLCGFANEAALEQILRGHLVRVQNWYAALFEGAEDLSVDAGSLVFTGVENDPETLRTLQTLGFGNASSISATIRRWHAGGMRATRTPRGRELLTKLVPPLLARLAKADNPDETFRAFERFLEHMPAGVQVFSLFLNNMRVVEKVVDLINLSPVLGRQLAERTHLIENLLDENYLKFEPSARLLEEATISEAMDIESILDDTRRLAREQRFIIAARFLLQYSTPRETGQDFTTIADACITRLAGSVGEAIGKKQQRPAGQLAILGMGRLGAEALTYKSDLDVVFIYDAPTANPAPDAPDAATKFTRLVRRLVTSLSVQTQEGALYEIDMQLRPSGRAGPIAVNFDSFSSYYKEDAWTWELMALLKARVIYGEGDLPARLEDQITRVLTTRRPAEKIRTDVAEMRQRLLREKPAQSPWDVKLWHGGLTDIDFIAQGLALIHTQGKARYPRHMVCVLDALCQEGVLPQPVTEKLIAAARLYDCVLHFERASVGAIIEPEALSPKQVESLLAITDNSSLLGLEGKLRGNAETIRGYFADLIGELETSDG